MKFIIIYIASTSTPWLLLFVTCYPHSLCHVQGIKLPSSHNFEMLDCPIKRPKNPTLLQQPLYSIDVISTSALHPFTRSHVSHTRAVFSARKAHMRCTPESFSVASVMRLTVRKARSPSAKGTLRPTVILVRVRCASSSLLFQLAQWHRSHSRRGSLPYL